MGEDLLKRQDRMTDCSVSECKKLFVRLLIYMAATLKKKKNTSCQVLVSYQKIYLQLSGRITKILFPFPTVSGRAQFSSNSSIKTTH